VVPPAVMVSAGQVTALAVAGFIRIAAVARAGVNRRSHSAESCRHRSHRRRRRRPRRRRTRPHWHGRLAVLLASAGQSSPDAIAGLGQVADTAELRQSECAWRRGAVVGHAVAEVGDVADASGATAERRALRVTGQLVLTPLQVSATSHTPTGGAAGEARVTGRMLADDAGAVAGIGVQTLPSSVQPVPFDLNWQDEAQHEPAVPFTPLPWSQASAPKLVSATASPQVE